MSTSDESTLSDLLLSKADALIRRNRPDGVGQDSEELPLLTEAIEDLPELTDAIELPIAAAEGDLAADDAPAPQVMPGQLYEVSLDLEDLDEPAFDGASPAEIDRMVREAVERTREELLAQQAEQEEMLRIRLRQEMLATHESEMREAIAQTRLDMQEVQRQALEAETDRLLAEAAQDKAGAIEAAREQGRHEAASEHQQILDEARQDAWQAASMQMSEHLIELDAYIAQSVEKWLDTELPQLISSELAGMVERLRVRSASHMRATLLPQLSEKLSAVLDSTLPDTKSN